MCFGGGGGNAAGAAQAQENQRKAMVSSNVESINKAYGGREGQYNDFGAALRKQYGDELQRQQAEAGRKSRFALARGGLTGGSAAIDTGRELSRESALGTLNAERQAQKGVSGLRSADEAARLQLISLAQSGTDIGNAGAQAASALKSNIGTAQATNAADTLGNIFGGTATTYKAQQDAAARRRGLKDANIYGGAFTRGTG